MVKKVKKFNKTAKRGLRRTRRKIKGGFGGQLPATGKLSKKNLASLLSEKNLPSSEKNLPSSSSLFTTLFGRPKNKPAIDAKSAELQIAETEAAETEAAKTKAKNEAKLFKGFKEYTLYSMLQILYNTLVYNSNLDKVDKVDKVDTFDFIVFKDMNIKAIDAGDAGDAELTTSTDIINFINKKQSIILSFVANQDLFNFRIFEFDSNPGMKRISYNMENTNYNYIVNESEKSFRLPFLQYKIFPKR